LEEVVMRQQWILGSLVVAALIMVQGPTWAFDARVAHEQPTQAERVGPGPGIAVLAQLTTNQSAAGNTQAAEQAQGMQLECRSGEIPYKGGCINKPAGQGKSLEEIGLCPEGYFKYEGRCHRAPRDEDIRREPLPKTEPEPAPTEPAPAAPAGPQECQNEYNECVQGCSRHRGDPSAYNQCANMCNLNFAACIQQ
jgi:hypothetical protein